MNISHFSQQHPYAYRRLLVIASIAMTLSGLQSMLTADKPVVFAVGSLALSVPHAPAGNTQEKPKTVSQPTSFGGLTRLPGKDGSGTQPAPAMLASASSGVGNDMRQLGRIMSAARFGDSHWPALNNLWTRESNWNPAARNPSSGACGIPQALPCSKIPDMSPAGQLTWGLTYIERRYGNPSNAWQFWLSHHWY
ncbi:MAG TPA: hypothetical protein VF272_03125 [Candidatus Saccharimonadia bacterium]